MINKVSRAQKNDLKLKQDTEIDYLQIPLINDSHISIIEALSSDS